MQINHLVLDHLVASQLAQLRNDESTLERTFEQLSGRNSDRTLQSFFLTLLANVAARATRLEHILDDMEGSSNPIRYGQFIRDGADSTWPYSTGWGFYPSGGLGAVLLVVLILALLGRV